MSRDACAFGFVIITSELRKLGLYYIDTIDVPFIRPGYGCQRLRKLLGFKFAEYPMSHSRFVTCVHTDFLCIIS
jgi:hypothetical protein